MEPDFQESYDSFMDRVYNSVVTGEDVGKQIARMAQYFGKANSAYATVLTAFNKAASDIEGTVDSSTGKSITSAKAKIMAAATEESRALIHAKASVESIDQMINALKSLQKGILNEYSHMGKM